MAPRTNRQADSVQLDARVRTMPFPELIAQVRPLVEHQVHAYLPGYDPEDVRQEMLEVLFRTQQTYDPEKGSFLNVLTRSLWNRKEWLRRRSQRQTQPITALVCVQCSTSRPTGWRPFCERCGGRSFSVERSDHALQSLDQLEAVRLADEGKGAASRWAQISGEVDPGYELVDEWLSLSTTDQQAALARWDP